MGLRHHLSRNAQLGEFVQGCQELWEAVDILAREAVCKDPNVAAVITKHKQRAEQGLQKYGVDTTRTDSSIKEWLEHLQEELMDAAVYIERILNDASGGPTATGSTTEAEAVVDRPDDGSDGSEDGHGQREEPVHGGK